jgi:hypothetical protein
MPTIVEHLDEESAEANTDAAPYADGTESAFSDDLEGLCSSDASELPPAQVTRAGDGRVDSILARLAELQVEEEEFEVDDQGDEIMLGKDVEDAESVVHDDMMSSWSELPKRVANSSCEVSVQVETSDLCLPHSVETSLADMHKQLQDMHLQVVGHLEARFKEHLGDWKVQVAEEVERQLSSKLNVAVLLDGLDFSSRQDRPISPTPNLDTEAATTKVTSTGDECWNEMPPKSQVLEEMAAQVREEITSIGVGLLNDPIAEARSELSALLQEPSWGCDITGSKAVPSECSANECLLCMEDILGELRTGVEDDVCQLLQKQHADPSCTMTLEQLPAPPATSCVVHEHSSEATEVEALATLPPMSRIRPVTSRASGMPTQTDFLCDNAPEPGDSVSAQLVPDGQEPGAPSECFDDAQAELHGCVEPLGPKDAVVDKLQKPVCSWFSLSPRAPRTPAEPILGSLSEAFTCEMTDAEGSILTEEDTVGDQRALMDLYQRTPKVMPHKRVQDPAVQAN